jgi:hypothetical protein
MIEDYLNPGYEDYSNPGYDEGSRPKCAEDERRVKPRLHCKGVARIAIPCVEAKIAGTLLDLSVSGCCIGLDSPMPAIENPRVEVLLTLKGISLRVAGIVRHIKSGNRAGIEFVEVTARRVEDILTLFKELVEMQNAHSQSVGKPRSQPK